MDTDGKAIISAELVERLERVQKMCAAKVIIAMHLFKVLTCFELAESCTNRANSGCQGLC